jgi:hypothetical protein
MVATLWSFFHASGGSHLHCRSAAGMTFEE